MHFGHAPFPTPRQKMPKRRRVPPGYMTMLDQREQNIPAASACIDSFVETQIQEALRVLMRGRTSTALPDGSGEANSRQHPP